jgi:MarR family transcriptional regulator, transcriptional regulator for hemolysin
MEPFAFQVVETARIFRRDFDRRAAALGVTRAQWRVLVRLSMKSGVRQIELADALDVEPITLCRMIDRLEEAGLVERRRDEADRRAWNIHLTAKSEPLIEELRALGDAFHDDALAGISREDQRAALDVLARVRANLDKAEQSSSRKAS